MSADTSSSVVSAGTRSPLLLTAKRSLLAIIDVQEKLFPSINERESLLKNLRFLLDAAETLNVRAVLTEQYPKGLGPTVGELSGHPAIAVRLEKLRFSAAEVLCKQERFEIGSSPAAAQVVLAGIESHVCIQQTALDLISQGIAVFVAADAVGSRQPIDHQQSLRRMEAAGVIVTTVESIAFEWCEVAGTELFRTLSRLIRTRDC